MITLSIFPFKTDRFSRKWHVALLKLRHVAANFNGACHVSNPSVLDRKMDGGIISYFPIAQAPPMKKN
jgi:hypothetical protein